MSDPHVTDLQPDVRAAIDAHLDAIDRKLVDAGLPLGQRRNVTDDVETQIIEMLAARTSGPATLADVKAILAELDPPDAFAASNESSSQAIPPRPVNSGQSRLSRVAVVGACLAIMFFWAFKLMFEPHLVRAEELAELNSWTSRATRLLLVVFVAIPGLLSTLLAPLCGFVAIRQIRSSSGRLYGLPLAIFDVLFFPMLLLGVLNYECWYYTYAIRASVEIHGWGALSRPNYMVASENGGLILLLATLTTLIVGFFITKAMWRVVRAPLPASSEEASQVSGGDAEPARRAAASSSPVVSQITNLFESGCLSLILAVCGALLALIFELMLRSHGRGLGIIVLLVCEVAAIVCGAMTWKTRMGKAGTIVAAILIVVAVLGAT